MFAKDQIRQRIHAQQTTFLTDLRQLIRISSVKSQPQTHAPFGIGPRQILDKIVTLAHQYGFTAQVVNDAVAYVQWGADPRNYQAIVGHLDVVAAGDHWTSAPFELTQVQQMLYGRGVLDNKGPSFACLYGMKILKELGVQPKRTIRLLFGSNEESGSHDIARYLAQEAAPSFGFTPDCKFPVVYGERGIVNYQITTDFAGADLQPLSTISGNQASDHVPDELQVQVNGQLLTIHGQRSPSNAPELGQNAITYLAKRINDQQLVTGALADYFQWLERSFHEKHFGQGLGLTLEDAASGKLIQTPYSLQKQSQNLILKVAMRYPVSYTEQQVTAGLKKVVPPNSQVQVIRSLPSVLHDPTDPRVSQLSQIYQQVTGLDATPVTTTGATYARVMPNIVAFGPSFPGQKGIAHRQDEWMKLSDLLTMMEIYTQAIYTMTR
ncbi:Sapep family Mn(2+)-dependent dipeptidase [Bombilactobacillus folatiphilus]|uniref:Sapep family Mn(2+)-dependent dipeptidase n=1 Tax=Bombilactobacillus folatiphilus TaxID=2923362 RepID=A0ABY4P979_9LACO|nr:Sapep family Mn(2+)-dependent dipeptidase [Bombilactobacillus folatiphilus]UQS82288.1 Sapep family Mn(2+)-dependent dipeptidase [Bombilactobacillus folatiphilus]